MLFFLLFLFWGKGEKGQNKQTKKAHSLRNFQATFLWSKSFNSGKITFVIAESKLWTYWDSPILTPDISVNIIHLTSDSET